MKQAHRQDKLNRELKVTKASEPDAFIMKTKDKLNRELKGVHDIDVILAYIPDDKLNRELKVLLSDTVVMPLGFLYLGQTQQRIESSPT